ncbi:MAG TPA: hypothetical protein VEZ90_09150 [Blastocatellia bacterium]|nr:hypothetical protein [Blastocatellia bacterium]
MAKSVLLICGTLNQTTQMHQIASELPGYEHHFTPYYGDVLLDLATRLGLCEFTVMGEKLARRTLEYLERHNLRIDHKGKGREHDLVITCSDLVVPKNIRDKNLVLVQEGMTDPENLMYHFVKRVGFLPRWLASTAANGLSQHYDYFCVASHGYRDLFLKKGARPEKIVVTGIPNFDNCARFLDNDFPHRGYVLVCTSDARETFKIDFRKRFIKRAVEIAAGRQLIFKLHPNEKVKRATAEINKYAPGSLVYPTGHTEQMIANCDVLITQYSSTTYVGLALGKEVHSYFDLDELRRLLPLQNRSGARNIAEVCRRLIEGEPVTADLKFEDARAESSETDLPLPPETGGLDRASKASGTPLDLEGPDWGSGTKMELSGAEL